MISLYQFVIDWSITNFKEVQCSFNHLIPGPKSYKYPTSDRSFPAIVRIHKIPSFRRIQQAEAWPSWNNNSLHVTIQQTTISVSEITLQSGSTRFGPKYIPDFAQAYLLSNPFTLLEVKKSHPQFQQLYLVTQAHR